MSGLPTFDWVSDTEFPNLQVEDNGSYYKC